MVIYIIDYKIDFTESAFYLKLLEGVCCEQNMVRELCYARLNNKSCPIFHNIDLLLFTKRSHIKCTWELWFKPKHVTDPVGLANRFIYATKDDKLDYFLRKKIPIEDFLELKKLCPASGHIEIELLRERLSHVLNVLIRGNSIYNKEFFEKIELGSDLEELAIASKDRNDNIWYVQLNSCLVNKFYSDYLEPKMYLNRLWKYIYNNNDLNFQASFFEFAALETLVTYFHKYQTEFSHILLFCFMGMLTLWVLTLWTGDVFPVFADKKTRFLTVVSFLWVSIVINIS